jgi:hypothetical protein
MIMLHDHPLEWAWAVIAGIDVWVSLSSWRAAHDDWTRTKKERAADGQQQDRRSHIASDAVTRAIDITSGLNASIALLLFTAAIVALFLPPPPPDYSLGRQFFWATLLLITASSLNAVVATYGRLLRYRLASGYFERQEAAFKAGITAGAIIAEAYRAPNGQKPGQAPSGDGDEAA